MDSEAELFKGFRSTFYAMEMKRYKQENIRVSQAKSLLLAGSTKGYQKKQSKLILLCYR